MASSNRHWPSLFKSKPCNTHQQWQHDINSSALLSGACHKSPYSSGCEERSPEPKPRWNPKPEQIRILEAIFNSGMVNPPRDEIRKIRAQLQEYGQVGDANVFYWFQNRKSRSKHKLRHLHPHPPAASSRSRSQSQSTASSTSSDKSSGASDKTPIASVASVALTTVTDRPTPPPPQMTNQLAPIGHVYYDFGAAAATAEPFFLQGGLGLWSELMMEQEEGEEGCKVNSTANKEEEEEEEEEEDGEGKALLMLLLLLL
ncbi:WUSCHEL-related homeobox 9-like [Ananas comosus]|uniref:WUSCHEL-related homeobox 9-like n=1 Tax=Ananas comosus TaxID=4615 RepID=A0A6P5GHR0_ANACO|nr:WUSCHEL-related homeobox 9-like [Ananas comosus]